MILAKLYIINSLTSWAIWILTTFTISEIVETYRIYWPRLDIYIYVLYYFFRFLIRFCLFNFIFRCVFVDTYLFILGVMMLRIYIAWKLKTYYIGSKLHFFLTFRIPAVLRLRILILPHNTWLFSTLLFISIV